MKRLTLAVAVLVGIGLIPSVAQAAFDVTSYSGTIVLDEDDPIVNPLSFKPTNDPLVGLGYEVACDTASACPSERTPGVPDGEDSKDDAGAPTWLHIRGQDESQYEIEITTEGPVVGTIDVYKYYPNGEGNTPRCTTQHVEELYPEEGQSFASITYLVKLRQITLGYHGVAAAGAAPNLGVQQVTLPASQTGYIVVIDARAGTGAGPDGAELGYEVTSDTAFNADHVENHWIQDPLTVVDSVEPCLERGVTIPPQLTGQGDIPGIGQQIGVQDLLGASLPEA